MSTPLAMTRDDYQTVRAELSFERHFSVTALFLLADLAIFGLGVWLLLLDNWTGFITAQFLFALVYFHNFAILHECGHEAASAHNWVNTLVGHYASIFCFLPYYPWKYIHTEHHSWAGILDQDPTLKAVRDYRKAQKVKNWFIRVAWKTWIPLLGLVQHFVFWGYPFQLLREGRMSRGRMIRSALSVALLPAAYLSLYFAWPEVFNFRNFGWSLLIYLVAVELVNFPHHLGTEIYDATERDHKLPLWEQVKVTRSCYYPPVFSEVLLLNFNFHIEHHLFPHLPWYNLRKVRRLVREKLGNHYQETIGISWNVENRQKDAEEVFLKDRTGRAQHPELVTPAVAKSPEVEEVT